MNKYQNMILIMSLLLLILIIIPFSINALSLSKSSYLKTLENNFPESSSYRAIVKNFNIQDNTIELHFKNGESFEFEVAKDILLIRGKFIKNINDFKTGDAVIVLIDKDDKIRFMGNISNVLSNIVSLKELGFESNVKLQTNKAERSFFFPLNEKIIYEDSVLSYYLNFSPLLKDDSTINITVEEEILFSSSLADIKNSQSFASDNNTAVIKIPLAKLDNINSINKNFIASTINVDLKISDNRCDDINNSGLWMNVLNKSQINYKYRPFVDYDINEFFTGNFDNLNIYLPENINQNTAEALLKLKTYLSRNFQHLNTQILQKNDFNNSYLYDFKTRNIFIENQSQKIELDQNLNLYLGSESATAFISSAADTFAADKVNINSFSSNDSKQGEDYLSFANLGFSTLDFKGIGEITSTVNFTTADLGRLPKNIQLVLNGIYTPPQKLKTVENNNSYLKIYLNEELIRVHQLSESGEFNNLPIELPSRLINQENNLSFAYSYYPIGSDCAADGQYFEGTIKDSSYLELIGDGNEEYLNFDNILTQLSTGGRLLLPAGNRFFYLKNAAEAFASFRKLDEQPVNIRVDFIEKNTAPELEEEDKWVFAVLPTLDYLDLELPFKNIDQKLEVQSNLDDNNEKLREKFLLDADIYNEFASWQLFKKDSTAYSVISASNESLNAQKQMENLISSVDDTDVFRSLEGNLLISSNNKLHNTSFFEEKDEIMVDKWKLFYQKYRQIIIILILLIVLTAAYWIYKNLAKMPEDM